jgi:hypothetical protein
MEMQKEEEKEEEEKIRFNVQYSIDVDVDVDPFFVVSGEEKEETWFWAENEEDLEKPANTS